MSDDEDTYSLSSVEIVIPEDDYKTVKLHLHDRNSTAPGQTHNHKKAKEDFYDRIRVATPLCSAPPKLVKPKHEENEFNALLMESAGEYSGGVSVRPISEGDIPDIPSELCSPSIDAKLIAHNVDRHDSAPPYTHDYNVAKDIFKQINVGGQTDILTASAPSKSKKHRKVKQEIHEYLGIELPKTIILEVADGGVYHTDDDILENLLVTSDLVDGYISRASRMHSEYSGSTDSLLLTSRLCSPDWDVRHEINFMDRNCSAPGHSHDHKIAKEIFNEIYVHRTSTPPCSAPSRLVKPKEEENEFGLCLLELHDDHSRGISALRPESDGEVSDIPSELCSPTTDSKLIGHGGERHGSAPPHTYEYRMNKDVFIETHVGRKSPSTVCSAPSKMKRERKGKHPLHGMVHKLPEALMLPAPDGGVYHTDDDILENLLVTSDLVDGYISRASRRHSEYSGSTDSILLTSRLCSPDWDMRHKINLMDRNCSAPGHSYDHRMEKEVFTEIHMGRPPTPSCSAPPKLVKPKEEENEFGLCLLEDFDEDSGLHTIRPPSEEFGDIPSELCSPSIDAKLIGHGIDRHGTAPPQTHDYKMAKDVFTEIHVGRQTESRSCSAPSKMKKQKKVKKELHHEEFSLPIGFEVEINDGGVHHTDDDILENLLVTSDLVDGYISRNSRRFSEYSDSSGSIDLPTRLCSPDWDMRHKINMMDRNCSAPGNSYDHRKAREIFTEIHVGRPPTPSCSAPPKLVKPKEEENEFGLLLLETFDDDESRRHSIRPPTEDIRDIPSELCSPSKEAKLIGHGIDRHGTAPPQTHDYKMAKDVFTEIHVGRQQSVTCSAPAKLQKLRKIKKLKHQILASTPLPTKKSPDVSRNPGIMITKPSQTSLKPPGTGSTKKLNEEIEQTPVEKDISSVKDIEKTPPMEPKVLVDGLQQTAEPKVIVTQKINAVQPMPSIRTFSKGTQTSGKKKGQYSVCNLEKSCCVGLYGSRRSNYSSVCSIQ